MPDTAPFRFNTSSRGFLERARAHLSAFLADGEVDRFFYAALELRFGIEARVTEYLKSALTSIGRDVKDVDGYVASRLLKRLAEINPDYERGMTLRLTSQQTGDATVLHYTPVTRELASIHGRLGELLHYKFFLNNEHWLYRIPLGGAPHRSLPDFVPLLEQGCEELERATSGLLLGHPRFTEVVEEVLNEGIEHVGGEGCPDFPAGSSSSS